jgi:hypothetical protein
VVWWGDSIAYDAAPGVLAAMRASGPAVATQAYPGKGTVKSRFYDPAAHLPGDFAAAGAYDLVVAQLSEWDLTASLDLQVAGLEQFYADVVAARPTASVVFVTAPPTAQTPGDDPDRVRLRAAAATVAAEHPGRAWLFDAEAVWGQTFERDMDGDGIPERKADKVHICPSGAARFAAWLVSQLAATFDGFTPPPDLSWVSGSWSKDKRYNDPPGTCARLS